MRLSGFSDEISPDLDEQCALMRELGASHLDFRSAWDVNVVELGAARIDDAARRIAAAGLRVACVASPVGKAPARDELDGQLAKLRVAIDAAHRFGTRFIRIFSFYIPEGASADELRPEVLDRMARLVEVAESEDVVLLHENETGTYGDLPSRCRDLMLTIDSPHLRSVIDPANFVLAGTAPFDEGYRLLEDHLAYLQVKDAQTTGRTVPAGAGDGQIPQLVAALAERGYDGFLSVEPHLGHSTGFGGFSGPVGFRTAWRALTEILDKEKVEYS